jgi:NCS2 family nucleobase:cation symporter-2
LKPSSIQYGVDERPPIGISVGSAVQHWMLGLASLGFPLLVIDEARRLGLINADQTHSMLMMSYLALGFSTLLQALRGRLVGAGYLIPTVYTAAFLPANLAALQVGGLGLVDLEQVVKCSRESSGSRFFRSSTARSNVGS